MPKTELASEAHLLHPLATLHVATVSN